MAFFITIIADYSESLFLGPSYCVSNGNGGVRIFSFSGLILMMAVLSVFLFHFIRGFGSVLGAQRAI